MEKPSHSAPSPLPAQPDGVPHELPCKTLPTFPSHLFVFRPEGNECVSANARSCADCIQAGAKCGWCKDPVREWKLSAVAAAGECSLAVFRCRESDSDISFVRLFAFFQFARILDRTVLKMVVVVCGRDGRYFGVCDTW